MKHDIVFTRDHYCFFVDHHVRGTSMAQHSRTTCHVTTRTTRRACRVVMQQEFGLDCDCRLHSMLSATTHFILWH